jgi:PAS domain-containing protein
MSKIITKEIDFDIDGSAFSKWLIKYPLRIHGNNRPLFLNLFIRPLLEGDAEFRFHSTQFLFNAVIDALPDLIFIKNTQGAYLGGNRAFFNFCGKSESEIVGKTDLQIFGEEKSEKYLKSDRIVFQAGLIWEGQQWDSMQTGETIRYENVKIPLRNKKNEIFG